jgi:hypothetical protein
LIEIEVGYQFALSGISIQSYATINDDMIETISGSYYFSEENTDTVSPWLGVKTCACAELTIQDILAS